MVETLFPFIHILYVRIRFPAKSSWDMSNFNGTVLMAINCTSLSYLAHVPLICSWRFILINTAYKNECADVWFYECMQHGYVCPWIHTENASLSMIGKEVDLLTTSQSQTHSWCNALFLPVLWRSYVFLFFYHYLKLIYGLSKPFICSVLLVQWEPRLTLGNSVAELGADDWFFFPLELEYIIISSKNGDRCCNFEK